ncbi:MAG: metallophosphoesterase family protein [Planctomycetota bacterium]|jgi:Icc-related predicted phosphoesterase
MKILVLADIDAFHWKWRPGRADVVVSCGDVAPELLGEAAEAFRCKTIFAVKGNHDSRARFGDPIIDLHLHTEQRQGVVFGGLSGSWKYKPRGNFLYTQAEVEKFLSTFPPVNVFVSHNSPRGIHDRDDHVHLGFEALNSYIKRARPRILLHGHQHVDKETSVAATRVIGVCGYRIVEFEPTSGCATNGPKV